MGTVVALHARFPAGRFRSGTLCFGTEWRTCWRAEEFLEFSEYGRDHRHPRGSWLIFTAGLGAMIWAAILAMIL